MITADQLFLHAVGDYVLQSDWMASRKTQAHFPAFCHALVYSLPFWLFRPSLTAWLVIFVTHFFIDRYRLARYICWAKNLLAEPTYWKQTMDGKWGSASNQEYAAWRAWIDLLPGTPMPDEFKNTLTFARWRTPPWRFCKDSFGYPPDRPAWMACWLLIACDNILHVCINASALRWL